MQAAVPEPAAGEVSVDVETMRAGVRLLLGPDGAPEALLPVGAELDTLTATLRGHVQLLVPEVEQAARDLPPDGVARNRVLGCVGEANTRLEAEPCQRYGGPVGYARRLARALAALLDHHEQLNRRALTQPPRVCHHCDEPIDDPDDAVYAGHEMGNSGPGWDIWAHRAHVDLLGPDPDAVRIVARLLVVNALRS